jgi:hypothetical protein
MGVKRDQWGKESRLHAEDRKQSTAMRREMRSSKGGWLRDNLDDGWGEWACEIEIEIEKVKRGWEFPT